MLLFLRNSRAQLIHHYRTTNSVFAWLGVREKRAVHLRGAQQNFLGCWKCSVSSLGNCHWLSIFKTQWTFSFYYKLLPQ